jgi:tryptophan synthase beta subunit
MLVRDFQSVIGNELKEQFRRRKRGFPTRWLRASAEAATP